MVRDAPRTCPVQAFIRDKYENKRWAANGSQEEFLANGGGPAPAAPPPAAPAPTPAPTHAPQQQPRAQPAAARVHIPAAAPPKTDNG